MSLARSPTSPHAPRLQSSKFKRDYVRSYEFPKEGRIFCAQNEDRDRRTDIICGQERGEAAVEYLKGFR